MIMEQLRKYLASPSMEAIEDVLDNMAFWVDWREEDTEIVRYCGATLQMPELSAIFTAEGVKVQHEGKAHSIPLTFSPKDRHLTILGLNQILAPDFQIRFCVASDHNDTLAFLPLPMKCWQELAELYQDLDQHFATLAPFPNLFTEGYTAKDWQKLALDPATKAEAIRLRRDETGCSLRAAKYEVDMLIFHHKHANAVLPEPEQDPPGEDPRQGTLF